jgi:uncharacterized protein
MINQASPSGLCGLGSVIAILTSVAAVVLAPVRAGAEVFASMGTGVNFVSINGPAIDKLLHYRLYYQRGTIPADLYGMKADVPTFGGRATLVTSASADARVVAVIAKAMLVHIADLRTLHPALSRLRQRDMIVDGLTAPLHPGAEQVYKELGLIE